MLLSGCPVPCPCSCSDCQRPAAAPQPNASRLAALIYSTAAAPPPLHPPNCDLATNRKGESRNDTPTPPLYQCPVGTRIRKSSESKKIFREEVRDVLCCEGGPPGVRWG
jgi:hypothetical protein